MTESIHVTDLYRYPVKGLSPEPVERVNLETSGFFPGDRLYAIENGPSGFNAIAPRHQPKTKYLMLMRDEALARLRTRYDDATATLTVEGSGEAQAFRLDTEAGRAGGSGTATGGGAATRASARAGAAIMYRGSPIQSSGRRRASQALAATSGPMPR